ncbi:MAG TPA: MinD/ParA family protein [Candidatus Dormibacteraeota bacterium]|nr:MinD/ParA family protein [Candidatus Dormibacteraeota bacterium]
MGRTDPGAGPAELTEPAAGTPSDEREGNALGPPLPPSARTHALLPRRLSWGERVGEALGAAVLGRRRGAPPDPVLGRSVGGAVSDTEGAPLGLTALAHRRRPGAVERARRAWQASDYLRRLEEAIVEPRLQRCATVAVVSPKGGVGKTTVTALLGTLLAMLRRDRIVAVDCNPDYGSLGRALVPAHHVFVDDLLALLEDPRLTVPRLDAALGRAVHGLMVAPTPIDPERMARLDQTVYARVIRRLQDLVGVILLDCGTGLHERAARAALGACDQVLLVSDAEPSTASVVAEAFATLGHTGRPTILVVNRMPGHGSELDLDRFAAHVPGVQAMLVVPEDLEASGRLMSGEFAWEQAPESWRYRVRELAALLTVQWRALDLAF